MKDRGGLAYVDSGHSEKWLNIFKIDLMEEQWDLNVDDEKDSCQGSLDI